MDSLAFFELLFNDSGGGWGSMVDENPFFASEIGVKK